VVVLDPLRRVVDANPAAERILGRPLADAVGHRFDELLPEAADAVSAREGADLAEEVTVARNGTSRRYEPTVVAVPDRQGPPVGWLVVLRDTSERHRTLRSLRQLDEQRRLLLERLVTSQEEERRQVAGDIHDDAIQAMIAVTLQLQVLGARLHDPGTYELLERLKATATESVGRLRQLVFELRPPLLDEVGLAAAVGQYANRAGELAGFTVQVSDEAVGELPAEVRVVAYRIVQEALANVRIHARASRVAIRLEEADGGVLVRVSDDGVGFLPGVAERRQVRGHLGLVSMREQAAMAGGWCRVASAPGRGTTVELWLPRPASEPQPGPDRSAGGPAAVQHQRGPVDERRRRRAQEQQRLGHLVGFQQPLDGRLGQHDPLDHLVLGEAVDPCLVGDLPLDQGRAHVGGADAVGGDAARAALQRDHLGQPLQAVLGRDIGALVGRRPQPVHRGDVDHPAPAPLVHARQDGPGQPERRLEHHRQHGREPLRRELLDRGHVLEAGVVDQHVGGQVEAVEAGRIDQVGDQGLPAELAGDPLGAFAVEVQDGDQGPGRGQPARAGLADAAGRTGDQGRPALQIDAHLTPPCEFLVAGAGSSR
jgi:PAS domain S-box-containing protein